MRPQPEFCDVDETRVALWPDGSLTIDSRHPRATVVRLVEEKLERTRQSVAEYERVLAALRAAPTP